MLTIVPIQNGMVEYSLNYDFENDILYYINAFC